MSKYQVLKDFILDKQNLVLYTFSNEWDDFGRGMKEAFRKIVEKIEEIENKNFID